MTASKKPTFDVALTRFKTATRSSMKYAQLCSEYAIQQFHDHGNLNQAQAFLDAMPKNYVRRTAFLKWLAAHSPVTMQENKLLKDVSEKAQPFNLEGALSVCFWDFAPDKEQIVWDFNDVVVALKRTVAKYENAERFAPKNEDAKLKLEGVKQQIAALG